MSPESGLPAIIQGGMGVGVSGWELAGAVAAAGQLGVVSGTALEFVYARRLQAGDPGGHLRRAFAHFPVPAVAQRILDRYLAPEGTAADERYKSVPMYTLEPSAELVELSVVANFAEVWLARERGQGGLVGINYLYKIQMPMLASIYGAMLARADAIVVGAGSPGPLPALISRLARGETASLQLKVQRANGDAHAAVLSPAAVLGTTPPQLPRSLFLAIVSSVEVARGLLGQPEGPDGFVVEGPRAGGHNAPPRGPRRLDGSGQPVYGPLDRVELEEIRHLGRPFWLAGSYGDPQALTVALEVGAVGVQVGTAFAFCEESGLAPELKARVLGSVARGTARVLTDPVASPTGFPFKVVQVPGSLSDGATYAQRRRVCDVGALRTPYKSRQGSIGYRCPAEPERAFSRKEGWEPATAGRKCLCNALLANIGLGQRRQDGDELPLLTAGDDIAGVARFVPAGADSDRAADVIAGLLGAA